MILHFFEMEPKWRTFWDETIFRKRITTCFSFYRSIRFEYDEKTNVEGASGYKYKLGKDFVSNSTCKPENGCYNPSPAPDHVRLFPKFTICIHNNWKSVKQFLFHSNSSSYKSSYAMVAMRWQLGYGS